MKWLRCKAFILSCQRYVSDFEKFRREYGTRSAYASAKGSQRSETNCSLQFAHLAGFGPAGL
jgi:hypothetical protein